MPTPTPEMLVQARRFTIAFAVAAMAGLAVGVVVPLVLPGPRAVKIALGSGCFVLIMVVGANLLRRMLIGGPGLDR